MSKSATTHRVLVVANDPVEAGLLGAAIDRTTPPRAQPQVLVVAPALNARFRGWTSDDDEAYDAAELRLRSCIDDLELSGYDANGIIGDADPLLATAEALRVFRADMLVIATHPERRANWLARNLIARARERFGLPVVALTAEAAPPLPEAA
jgi:hypothetical protein